MTFLDNPKTANRLFSAHIPSLEDQAVLIAHNKQQCNGPLYAVERVSRNVYILCRLGDWVGLDHVRALASISATQQDGVLEVGHEGDQAASWWKKCVVPEPDTAVLPSLAPRKAPRLSMARPESLVQDIIHSPPDRHTQYQYTAIVAREGVEAEAVDVETAVTSAEDVFGRFIKQYLETLYLSRTPLAFFAKGPVSRARAAFTSGQIETSSLTDLVDFLRNMIQSSSSADKKYRDKFPEMLKKLPARGPEDDNVAPVKEKKKRKKRRLKPDKYGILPDEDDYFEKWWNADDDSAPADQTADQYLKKRSAQLRTRETFMQLIVVLEVLSLEAMPEVKEKAATGDAESHAHHDGDSQQKSSKTKSKKSDNLSTALELLLDKLAIWHSLDTGLMLDNSQADGPNAAKDKTKDELRNFCVEVIIPFYMSRIPDHAANVNKKLGGPSTSTTTTKSKNSSSRSKPGEPEIRQRPDKKPRKQLHRVATETANATISKSAPSLRHSITDPQSLAAQVKREASEAPSLSQIPSFRRESQTPTVQPRRASGIQGLRAREVDFTALATANEAKQKKRAEVEEKLRDAISVLKRPNRSAANKDIADVAEQRRLMANARARPSLAASRARKSQDKGKVDVQVGATPMKQAHKSHHLVAATPRHPQPTFSRANANYSQPAAPSSGPSIISSSSMRPPAMPTSHYDTYSQPQYTYAEVEEDTTVPATGRRQRTVRYELEETTPSKPASRMSFDFDRREMSPLQEEEDDDDVAGLPVFQTPSKPTRSFDHFQETPSRSADRGGWRAKGKEKENVNQTAVVAATPVKASVVATTPVKARALSQSYTPAQNQRPDQVRSAVQEMQKSSGSKALPPGKSIYDVLGWDDDFPID